ncbi:hypothetical protein ACIRL2_23785 [Embleya sp. NPDC127516]|uniref:hypothetical protein n=1 Tax=Embleya sp. NPDC127516 TaxID=3363990 RepID=UPI00381D345C
MAEFHIEFKDAAGNKRGSRFFSEPTDTHALTTGRNLLTSAHRTDKRIVLGTVSRRVLFPNRAKEIADLKV